MFSPNLISTWQLMNKPTAVAALELSLGPRIQTSRVLGTRTYVCVLSVFVLSAVKTGLNIFGFTSYNSRDCRPMNTPLSR